MRRKIICTLSVIFVLSISLLLAVGCSKRTIEKFDVPSEMEGEYKTVITLPIVVATLDNGDELTASVSVKDDKGNAVTVTANKFFAGTLCDYTATYTVDQDGVSASKDMLVKIQEGPSSISAAISGKKVYVYERGGEKTHFDLTSDLTSYYYEMTTDEKLQATYAVTNSAGVSVEVNDNKFALGDQEEIYSIVPNEFEAEAITVLVLDKKTDTDSNLVYADFESVLQSNLFEYDYDVNVVHDTAMDTGDNFYSSNVLMKDWQQDKGTLRLTFRTDGFADFSKGGVVSFDHTMGCYETTGMTYELYYKLADGERTKIGNFENYHVGETSSFIVPKGGTLAGGYIEVVMTKKGATNFMVGFGFDNFIVDTKDQLAGTTEFLVADDVVDISQLSGIKIVDCTGAELVNPQLTYEVYNEQGESVTLDGTSFAASYGIYTVKVIANGVKLSGDVTVNVITPRTTEDGKQIYADFSSGADFALFETDFPVVNCTRDEGDIKPNAMLKDYTTAKKELRYYFTSDGGLDLSMDGVFSFDHANSAYLGFSGVTYDIYYCLPGGERTKINDTPFDTHVYGKATSSFRIPAGSTLVGGYIEVVMYHESDNYGTGIWMDNFVFDSRLSVAGTTEFLVADDVVDISQLSGIKIVDCTGREIGDLNLSYEVYDEQGESVTLDGTSFAVSYGIYTVKVLADGEELSGDVTVNVITPRTTEDGKQIYADFSSGADFALFETDFPVVNCTRDEGDIKPNAMLKDYTTAKKELRYYFTSDGGLDLSVDGVFSFDHANSTYLGFSGVTYDIYYCLPGGERTKINDTPFDTHVYGKATSSFRIPAGSTLVGGYIEVILSHPDGNYGTGIWMDNFMFDTNMSLSGELAYGPYETTLDTATLNGYQIMDAAGNVVSGTEITYKVYDGQTEILLTGTTATLETNKVYRVEVYSNGKLVSGSLEVFTLTKKTLEDGSIVFADFESGEAEECLFDADFDYSIRKRGENGEGCIQSTGIIKQYTDSKSTIRFTFASNGFGDFSTDTTVKFSHQNNGYLDEADPYIYSVYYGLLNGERVLLGTFQTHVYSPALNVSSFVLPAGTELKGAYIEFESNRPDGEIFMDDIILSAAE